MGLEINGQFKAYPYKELALSDDKFTDRFAGQEMIVEFDSGARSARISETDGNEIPTVTAYWFAWTDFHPDTEVYTHQ